MSKDVILTISNVLYYLAIMLVAYSLVSTILNFSKARKAKTCPLKKNSLINVLALLTIIISLVLNGAAKKM